MAPADGIYLLTLKATLDNTSGGSDDRLDFVFTINNAGLDGYYSHNVPVGYAIHGNASIHLQLSQGDTLQVKLGTINATSIDQIRASLTRM